MTEMPRKPRIAIMGEFSAGKSTLCNLLMRARPLPEKVTATRLSPVWMTKGPGENVRVTLDDEEVPVDIADLEAIPLEETRYIRLHLDADVLNHCDIIDFPGISDPNMDPQVWERVLVEADAVIWLTHATQAWRQTEAAVWDTVDEEIQERSVLLITRFDKLLTETDRARVLNRIQREAGLYFDEVFPISLLEALEGVDDYEKWQTSGAEAFMDHMAGLIARLGQQVSPAEPMTPVIVSDRSHEIEDAAEPQAAPVAGVQPRRVKSVGGATRLRRA